MDKQYHTLVPDVKTSRLNDIFNHSMPGPTIGLPVLRRTELKKLETRYKKMRTLYKAQYEVALFYNQVEVLKSIHKTHEQSINWVSVANEPAPISIGTMGMNEKKAREQRDSYKPSLLDQLFRRVKKKIALLDQEINKAIVTDEQIYNQWRERTSLAEQVVIGQKEAYLTVVEQINIFDDIKEYGSSFEVDIDDPDHITVRFEVNSSVVIPTVEKQVTKTGRLSVNVMSKTKYYDLYQEFVCSCMIRIARDLFSILPVHDIYIHAMDTRLNSSTGYNEKQTLLSVHIPREPFLKLDFNRIDCSDALLSFKHHIHFVRTVGFKPVEQLRI